MIFSLFLGLAAAAPLLSHVEPVKDEYIVVFKKGISQGFIQKHVSTLLSTNATMLHKYDIGSFKGYAARMDQSVMKRLLDLDEVDYVEQNGVVRASQCLTQSGATWGISRVTSLDNDHKSIHNYCSDGGKASYAYVVDTGIYCEHTEFTGRCTYGFSVEASHVDGNGHGTHVAGTIAGTIYGLAKHVNLIAVKVLSAGGSGTTAGVISGIDWAANDSQTAGKKGKSVANLSLGGGFSTAMNSASDAAVERGLVMVVAAGNSNADACNFSPASAANVISVGATEDTDARASYSNIGTCMKLFAPGTAITSAWIGDSQADRTISGTSMASPHVAGWVALYLSVHTVTPDELLSKLMTNAQIGVVTNPGAGSPNYFLYGSCAIHACA